MSSSLNGLGFRKIVGTGNDFIFIDARSSAMSSAFVIPQESAAREKLASKLADRRLGVGADGVVFVESGEGSALRWDFYNSDGSSAEMCGNAARCMARWALEVLGRHEVQFSTAAGLVRSGIENTNTGEMPWARLDFLQATAQNLRLDSQEQAVLINTGVPHVVVRVNDLLTGKQAFQSIAKWRWHEQAGPRGANVTLVQKNSDKNFSTVTFERGVEDFTLSCGTGVLAAAIVGTWGNKHALDAPILLETPGGQLRVQILEQKEVSAQTVVTSVQLNGAASTVFVGQIVGGTWQ